MCTLDSVATEFQNFLLFEKGLETGNLQKKCSKNIVSKPRKSCILVNLRKAFW